MSEFKSDESNVKWIWKNVLVGTNPEGKKIFEKQKVRILNPDDPDIVPTSRELPPIDPETGKEVSVQDDFFDIVEKKNREK